MDACQKVYLSTLGIYDLSSPNPDTYLELGISVGLNKPALIIAGQGMTSAIPAALNRATTWYYTPPLKGDKDLQRAVVRSLNRLARTETAGSDTQGEAGQLYCAFCDSVCKGWRKQTHGKGFFLLDGRHAHWESLRGVIKDGLQPTGLIPIYLSQLKGRVMPLLCEMRLAVLASEFVLIDLRAPCDPEQLIALGMTISMRRPWLLTAPAGERLPELLTQTHRLEYASDRDLEQHVENHVLKTLYPSRYSRNQGVTAQLDYPFWLQLEDWIGRFESRRTRVMEGVLQLLLVEEGQLKQRCRMTPDTVVTAGRDPESDLIIEAQGASRFHADFIFTGQELLVVDRESTNGTFVNGNRVASKEQISLQIGDHIRMGPAEVVVWDEHELPAEVNEYLPETGRIVPQTIFVNLSDGLVLANGRVPVARLSSSELGLLEFMSGKGGDTTSASEIAEIVYGTREVSRMIVASFMDRLRAKIEPSPADPRFLVSVPGKGYRLRMRGGQLVLRPR
jgi:pSer/pThr/pTyr-binding forkhead associated (FHA) protein